MNLGLDQTSAEVGDFMEMKRQKLDEEFEDDFKEQDYQRIDAYDENENLEEVEVSNAFAYYRRHPFVYETLKDIGTHSFFGLSLRTSRHICIGCGLLHWEATKISPPVNRFGNHPDIWVDKGRKLSFVACSRIQVLLLRGKASCIFSKPKQFRTTETPSMRIYLFYFTAH